MALANERVDSLEHLSELVYDSADRELSGITVARRIILLSIQTVAAVLQTSHGIRFAGDAYHSILVRELDNAGLSVASSAYETFANYRAVVSNLPPNIPMVEADEELIELAEKYAKVPRRTVARSGEWETDASHVVHLSALALPYAAEYYSYLDQSKIALYCLIHDIVEAYAGDVATLGASASAMAEKDRAEAEALKTITNLFGIKYPKFIQCILDYEHLIDDEARFVKTFDKLDPGFTHDYSNGSVLINYHGFTTEDIFNIKVDEITERMLPYSGDYKLLMEDRDELTARVAKHTPWPQQ